MDGGRCLHGVIDEFLDVVGDSTATRDDALDTEGRRPESIRRVACSVSTWLASRRRTVAEHGRRLLLVGYADAGPSTELVAASPRAATGTHGLRPGRHDIGNSRRT